MVYYELFIAEPKFLGFLDMDLDSTGGLAETYVPCVPYLFILKGKRYNKLELI